MLAGAALVLVGVAVGGLAAYLWLRHLDRDVATKVAADIADIHEENLAEESAKTPDERLETWHENFGK